MLACSSDSSNPLGPPPPAGFSATGDWTYTTQLADKKDGITCAISGLMHLRQSGSALAGSAFENVVCQGNGVASDTATTTINSGTLSGTAVAMDVGGCSWTGQVYMDGTTTKASGSVSCNAQSIKLTGSFTAVFVGDVTPPAVMGDLVYPQSDNIAVPGDHVSVEIDATDNVTLRWMGYEAGAPLNTRDSVAVTGASAHASLSIIAPVSGPVAITFFARDSAGLVGTAGTPLGVLAGYVRRPTAVLPLAAAVQDIAIDSAHALAYLALANQRQIAVVDLTARSYAASVALPVPGISVDVTRSGDSLLVAADSSAAVAVVRLSPRTITTITLPHPGTDPMLPFWTYRVRAMANNKAIVSVTDPQPYDCCVGYLEAIDLATGTAVIRGDGGLSGSVSNHQLLDRSADAQTLVFAWTCCTPFTARKYSSATDAFGPVTTVIAYDQVVFGLSPDRHAQSILVSNTMMDANFSPLWTYNSPDLAFGGLATLSPDGAYAYLATTNGYVKLRTSDQSVVEHVRLPVYAQKGAISPDGNTLIVASGTPTYFQSTDRLLIVDLR